MNKKNWKYDLCGRMLKIEKLMDVLKVRGDVVNERLDSLETPKQTQEPEMKEIDKCVFCQSGVKVPKCEHEIVVDGNGGTICRKCNYKPTKKDTMPCGHKLSDVSTGDEGTSYCRKCEEAAKKECEQDYRNVKKWNNMMKKDELADILMDVESGEHRYTLTDLDHGKLLAEAARKWAVEVVEKIDNGLGGFQTLVKKDELISRLKG